MVMRRWFGAIAVLAIAPPPPADATVFRIQARPLPPPSARAHRPPALRPMPAPADLPEWLELALRLVNGRALLFARPSWEGPVGSMRWRVGLEAGLEGRKDLGFGPAVGIDGRLSGPTWGLRGRTTALFNVGGVSWVSELTLGREPLTLSLRTWDQPGASPLGQSATLALRRAF